MAVYSSTPLLGPLFARALAFTTEQHNYQLRKSGRRIPYLAHPLAVASLVLEAGGNEYSACAALLHDVIEDADVHPVDLRREFGAAIAHMVGECTEDKTAPWEERKQATLDHLPLITGGALQIKIADKLHNLRSLALSFWEEGRAAFDRFTTRAAMLDWYVRYADAFEAEFASRGYADNHPLCAQVAEQRSIIHDLQQLLWLTDHADEVRVLAAEA